MDSKAKQRLTGAVILVALFVLLVPELLTGPGKQAAQTPDETGLRRYTIDIDSPQSSVQPIAPATPAEVKLPEVTQVPPAGSAPAVSAPLPAPSDADRAQPGEAASATASPERPVATAPAPAAPAAASAPARPTPMVSPAPTPVAATPAPAPQRAAPSVAGGSFAVQLGTFENRDNANRLVRDMTAKGFAAFVAPFRKEGRELYRVRVGPTRDRAAAEALAAQLKRVGQPGSVVSIS